ncbi:unnamed protein product, partial [Discosporangium mesarthrocarpum]
MLASLMSLPVAVGHILLGGLLSVMIVMTSHTGEDLIVEDDGSFVETQFKTTRNAILKDPFSRHLWGGMEYQLEHHFFPRMPVYNYKVVAPLLKDFAARNHIEYRISCQWDII